MLEVRNGTRDRVDQALWPVSSEHQYLTVVETALRARLSPKALYKWISMGKITRAEGVHPPAARL